MNPAKTESAAFIGAEKENLTCCEAGFLHLGEHKGWANKRAIQNWILKRPPNQYKNFPQAQELMSQSTNCFTLRK
jgi:hypothetical protein